MASVHDVAAYILRECGPMSTMKLQKLAYYSQAWHLAWVEEPLFDARIEAWALGPVVRELYAAHRGRFSLDSWPRGNADNLSKVETGTIDAVLGSYAQLDGRKLSYLTHSEGPWRDARRGLAPTALSTEEITIEAMQSFYAALDADDDAKLVDDLDWGPWDASDPAAR